MKISNLLHKHGGKITDLRAIEHRTYRKATEWFFRGRVEWDDGSVSAAAEISPIMLCTDGSEASTAEVNAILEKLHAYLLERGDWNDNGRWIPKAKAGALDLA
ncbi:MAG TPA: hypothetical protein VGM15_03085 [Burkholderiaceae bacterium]|jgi:hypothetical protein